MTNIQHKLLRLSNELIKLPQDRSKHFSFIVERNRVISIGWNQRKTHPKAKRFGHMFASTHSELSAILHFPYPPGELGHYTFYNVRLTRSGEIKCSAPCRACKKLLAAFGIQDIVYTTDDGRFVIA